MGNYRFKKKKKLLKGYITLKINNILRANRSIRKVRIIIGNISSTTRGFGLFVVIQTPIISKQNRSQI